jgi:4a-hydroxytetrahydrobiopterin dehydratase
MEKKKEDSWEEVSNRLMRTYYFKGYDEVIEFVNKVMNIAKKQDHHPDITVHYDNVKLSIHDHKKGKVTEKCHKLAVTIDKIK